MLTYNFPSSLSIVAALIRIIYQMMIYEVCFKFIKMNKNKLLQKLRESLKAGKLTKESFINRAMDIHRLLFNYTEIIKNTDVNKISITPNGLSFFIGDEAIEMFIPPEDKRVAPIEIMNFGKYEPNETIVMNLISSDAKHIFDIGANIGYYSIYFAKRYPNSIVHSFEPVKTNYSYLKQNILANEVESQVLTYNLALSDSIGDTDFFIPPNNGANASMINVSNDVNSKKEITKMSTLDQFCKDQNIKPNFIKCDTEGSELLVFQGAKKILLIDKPVIFSELLRKWSKPFGYHPNEMITFFNKLGYLCFGIGENKVRHMEEVTEDTVETNYVFLHSNAHVEILNKLKSLKW